MPGNPGSRGTGLASACGQSGIAPRPLSFECKPSSTLDPPGAPSALFDPSVTLADVQAKLDDAHPPAFVSSVTYGRMVLFTFESQYSATALDFAYSGGVDVSPRASTVP